MNAEEALQFVESLFSQQGSRLNDLQRAVFRGAWQGKAYKEIHRECSHRCSLDHLKQNVGPDLWKQLTAVLEERVTKNMLQGPVERAWKERHSLESEQKTSAQSTQVNRSGNRQPSAAMTAHSVSQESSLDGFDRRDDIHFPPDIKTRQDWDSAPDVSQFYGRDRELTELEQLVTLEGCRLVNIFGVGGVGKTDLSVRLAQQLRDQFECVIWRSLCNWRSLDRPPFLEELLEDLIPFLSDQQETGRDLSQLVHHMSNAPCLVVLDGFESVLRSGVYDGSYRPGYEMYGKLLRRLGRGTHQSCLLLTSQEKPKEIARMEGEKRRVRSWKLEGLGEIGGQSIFSSKGGISGSEADWITLIRRYGGHPLALNVVATMVWEVFDGQITEFMEQIEQEPLIFGEIYDVLRHQFERLSELERTILHCLAAQPEPTEVKDILRSLTQPPSRIQLHEGLQALLRRSLIEVDSARYSLHPLMMEYVLNSRA